MRVRSRSAVGWSIATTSFLMVVGALVLMYLDRHANLPSAAASDRWNVSNILNVGVNAAGIGIGLLLATKRPANPIGWLFLAAGSSLALNTFGVAYGVHAVLVRHPSLPFGRLLAWLGSWTGLVPLALLPFLFLLFPSGHLPSARWRPVARVLALAFVPGIGMILVLSTKAWSHPYRQPSGGGVQSMFLLLVILPILVALLVSLFGLVVRFRRSAGEERLQLKWFVAGAILLVLGFVPGFFSSGPNPGTLLTLVQAITTLFLFAAIGVAVLKYRLYEIDVVISRTIVYALLAAFFTLVYLAVVVGVGAAIGSARNPFLTVLAAAVIAIAFSPVRNRATRLANRVAYGKRATPYEVLSEFAEKMGGGYSLEDVLPRTARMLAEGTGATRADVWLAVDSGLVDEGRWPDVPRLGPVETGEGESIDVPGAARVVPVRHQAELLGALSIHKSAGDPVSPVEEKLLADVAAQAGLMLRNARLIEDLRASRQRIVAAQDQERRRLERNIHDGAQQQLVALAVKTRLADALVARDQSKAHDVLAQIQAELQDALENLRDLARGIYPPLLADQGLAAALSAQARKSPVPVSVDPDGIGRYPQEAEAAVYFCALEALQNVAKYAQASRACVRLAASDGRLTFEIVDDGAGFDPHVRAYGTGMQGMADRLAALGGGLDVSASPGRGTTVRGWIPVEDA
jgi:signal transduction histidine kinase